MHGKGQSTIFSVLKIAFGILVEAMPAEMPLEQPQRRQHPRTAPLRAQPAEWSAMLLPVVEQSNGKQEAPSRAFRIQRTGRGGTRNRKMRHIARRAHFLANNEKEEKEEKE